MTNSELEQCIAEYGRDIYSFCKHITCNLQEADDLYQDTFLKAIELNERIDYDNNPKSFLLSIALRIWKNRRRKYAWRKRIADMQPSVYEQGVEAGFHTGKTPEEQLISREEKQIIKQSVDKLPKRLRMIILLYYMEEQSVAQIAIILKIPQGTVKSRLYQARKLLEKELEDVLYEKRYR